MNDLTERLNNAADEFTRLGGTELHLDAVLDRAGEIRRGRRMRATMAMAAVVLAVAVPTALVATRSDHVHKPVTPAREVKVDRSPLTLDGLDIGSAPKGGYLVVHTWHSPDGDVDLSGLTDIIGGVATYEGGLLVATQSESGERTANIVDVDGSITGKARPMEGGFAVSDDGKFVAFVQPDGTPVVVSATGEGDSMASYTLPKVPHGGAYDAVAVNGDCASGGCTVWVSTRGRDPEVWMSTSDGLVTAAAPTISRIDDVLDGEVVAGMTSATDDGSCSAVGALDRSPTWSTCDFQLGTFSPDGQHLSAYPAYFDGAGSSELAVLDAGTGTPVLDLHATPDTYIGQAVWEDDTHLLVVVGAGARAAILRVGLDGSREYAVPPTDSEPYVSPFVLAAR